MRTVLTSRLPPERTAAGGQRVVSVLNAALDVYDDAVVHWLTLAGYPADLWQMAKESPTRAG